MSKPVEYYKQKFGSNIEKAFVHLAKEMGELAGAIEKNNKEVIVYDTTEIAGMLFYFADQFNFNLLENVEAVYTKKLEKLQQK
ncbi:hypothetical protein HY570_00265 [Candidatus Micrarchaeota archaeon]|nr:hypothetical protein [Candidatus Micrarchaeota archaeon]